MRSAVGRNGTPPPFARLVVTARWMLCTRKLQRARDVRWVGGPLSGGAPHIMRLEARRAAARLDLEAQRVDDQPAQRRFPGETGAVPRFGNAGAGVGAGGGWLREGGPAPPARLLAPRKPRLEGSGKDVGWIARDIKQGQMKIP